MANSQETPTFSWPRFHEIEQSVIRYMIPPDLTLVADASDNQRRSMPWSHFFERGGSSVASV
jgi:hypothetical protein